jgi:hypothetical protein
LFIFSHYVYWLFVLFIFSHYVYSIDEMAKNKQYK